MSCAGILRHGKVRVASRRRGAILVLTALLLVFLVTMVAFTIDVGYMLAVRSEAKRATDAAALAGAGELINGVDAARVEAFEYLNRNLVGNKTYAGDEDWNNQLISTGVEYVNGKQENVAIETGHWNYEADPPAFGESDTRFQLSQNLPSAIRVGATQAGIPSLFGTLISTTGKFSMSSESVAGYQPRDIVVVLDLSASMNDDSELKRITSTDDPDREAVESNLAEIWEDLGPPSYGSLVFEPQYVTISKTASNGVQLTATPKADKVSVTATKSIQKVTLYYDNSTTQSFYPGSLSTDCAHSSSRYVTSASVKADGVTTSISLTRSSIAAALGLNGVPYPYPNGGSWDSYIKYVQTSSSPKYAGYKNMFGGMTLASYWLESYPQNSQVPDLWKVRAQPVQAVKDAVDVFMEYIQEVDSDDQVALVVYNSTEGHAKLEHALTNSLDEVADTVKHRQAGHYSQMTNIGAGINIAREELNNNARIGAFKMIVLMTDGQANTSSDPGLDGPGYALSEASKAAGEEYPIVTISLGNSADKTLMQTIADTTEGFHFNIPGLGTAVTDYRPALLQTFRDIANDRPLLLVK